LKYLWISALFAFNAHAVTLNSWLHTREGTAKFKDKNYRQAYQHFMAALEDDPLKAETHMNIARSLEANEEFDKAAKGYEAVIKFLPKDSPLRFEAYFNLGDAYGKAKKIPQALEAYQAALEMDPDNIEVKTNVELLMQQQGGGEGEGDSQSDKQDQNGKGGQSQNNPQQPQQKKQQPKPFNSQELTKQDVKKILDEIKNQEQAIRAQENEKHPKEGVRDKDW
jgi:tetratricopeptide (TPR) repeat protein